MNTASFVDRLNKATEDRLAKKDEKCSAIREKIVNEIIAKPSQHEFTFTFEFSELSYWEVVVAEIKTSKTVIARLDDTPGYQQLPYITVAIVM